MLLLALLYASEGWGIVAALLGPGPIVLVAPFVLAVLACGCDLLVRS